MQKDIYKRTKPPSNQFKKGQHPSPNTEFKKGFIPYNKGKKCPEIGKRQLGKLNHRFGKHHTEKWKKNMSKILKGKNRKEKIKKICLVCNKEFEVYPSLQRINFCSVRCSGLSMRGKNAPNWKDGLSSLNSLIRQEFKYCQWRSDIFTRDNFTCRECGKKGGILEAHHSPKTFLFILREYKIKNSEEADNCEELWNLNNGMTLCKKCHNKTKRRKNDYLSPMWKFNQNHTSGYIT